MLYTVDCIKRGDYREALSIAGNHKGSMLSIGIPLVVLVRFPWLIMGGFAFFFRFQSLLYQLLYVAGVTGVHKMIWKKLVKLAKDRNKVRRN